MLLISPLKIINFLEKEFNNKLHVIKCILICILLYTYFTYSYWIDLAFNGENSERRWDFVFAIWRLMFAIMAQIVSLSSSKMVRFFAGMAVAWFISDMLTFIIPHNIKEVTERNTCDYMVIIGALIVGCMYYHANTKIYNLILKWQKRK